MNAVQNDLQSSYFCLIDLNFLHEWSNWTEINRANGECVSFMTKLATIITKIFIKNLE